MTKSFNFRTLISLLLGWSFMCLMLSGIVLYLSPAGRIANWNGWTLVGLHKDQWQAIHVVVALIFLVGGGFHLLKFNWRPFKNYLSVGGGKARRFYRELAVSLGLFVLFLVGAAGDWVPFSYLLEGSESAKDYWEARQQAAPVPHMELMTVAQVSRQLDAEPKEVIESLQANGAVAVTENDTLQGVAAKSKTTPSQVYKSLRTHLESPVAGEPGAQRQPAKQALGPEGHFQGAGSGWGRKTIEEVAAEIGVESATVVDRLRLKGLDAKPDENLRDIAQRYDLRPYELADIIRGKQ